MRISFARGKDSASVSDRVRGDEEAEYVAAARARQEISIIIQAQPPRSVVVALTDPDGNRVVLNRKADRWSAKLNATGDYQLAVQKRKQNRTASRYRMTIKIS